MAALISGRGRHGTSPYRVARAAGCEHPMRMRRNGGCRDARSCGGRPNRGAAGLAWCLPAVGPRLTVGHRQAARRADCRGLRGRQPAGAGTARVRRRTDPVERSAAQGLVRVSGAGSHGSGRCRGLAELTPRHAVRSRRHSAHPGLARRVGAGTAGRAGSRRRGDLHEPAVLLLPGDDHDRRRASSGRPAGQDVLGPGSRLGRRHHHRTHPSAHRQLPEQPDRQDRHHRDPRGPGRTPPVRRQEQRAAGLPALRRGVQPHPVRRQCVPQSRRVLSMVRARADLQQDCARPQRETRLPRPATDDARPGARSRRVGGRPTGRRMGGAQRGHAVRASRHRRDVDRPGAPAGEARQGRRRPARARIRADRAGGDLLRPRALAHPRRLGVHRAVGEPRRVHHARQPRRASRLLPDLTHRDHGHDRLCASGIRRGSSRTDQHRRSDTATVQAMQTLPR